MALSEFQRAHITKCLSGYCEDSVPQHARDQVRLSFRLGTHDVVLFEERVRWDDPQEWVEIPIAKFRYVASHREWRLYCRLRDLRWHEYEPCFAAPDFETLLTEVKRDSAAIFWG